MIDHTVPIPVVVMRKPKIVIFDLDNTLWPYTADTEFEKPFSNNTDGEVIDAEGAIMELLPDVVKILESLRVDNVLIAVASKTWSKDQYMTLLELFNIREFFIQFEMFCGHKHIHVGNIVKAQDLAFEDVLFFDDQAKTVQSFNDGVYSDVTAIHCPAGISWQVFEEGLAEFNRSNNDFD